MLSLDLDGVRLAYVDHQLAETDGEPLVFVHGWTCDHSFFAPQISHVLGRRRAVAMDLRGHGGSDAPRQSYDVGVFAADVVRLIETLGLGRSVVVGHSMGGLVGLEVARRRPELVSGLMMIDTVLLPPPGLLDAIGPVASALGGEQHDVTLRAVASQLFVGTDDAVRRERIITRMLAVPPHVAASAFAGHLLEHDPGPALDVCEVAMAYVAAAGWKLAELARLQARRPDMMTGQTLGAGHFSTLEAPDQVNAMLDRFLALLPDRSH